MRWAAAILMSLITVALVVAVVGCTYLAIWTTGHDSNRLAATAFMSMLFAVPAVPLTFVAWAGALE